MAKVQGRQSQSIGRNHNTVVTGILYVGYGCTEGFPDTGKTTNRWRSVDTHPQNGVVTIQVYLLPIQAANMSVMHNSDQITVQWPYLQDHKSLTLCWRSISEWGGNGIGDSFAYKSCQYVSYAQQRPDYCSVTKLTRPQIIDAPLTLISMNFPFNICCHR